MEACQLDLTLKKPLTSYSRLHPREANMAAWSINKLTPYNCRRELAQPSTQLDGRWPDAADDITVPP